MITKESLKNVSCEELLEYFNIHTECKSIDELYKILETHTPDGYPTNRLEKAITNAYWDYDLEEFFDGITIEPTEGVDFVIVGDRVFEIPQQQKER